MNGYWANNTRRIAYSSGSNADIIYYLTLRDANGNMSESGTAELKHLIPTGMRAKSGYYKGRWDVTPPDVVSGTDSVVYTYWFVAKNSQIPDTGDTSNILMWVLLMNASAVMLVAVVIVDRKRKNR